MTTPTSHVVARPSRQEAMKYWPHRWSTTKTKKSWTLQKWMLLTKRPTPETWNQPGPKKASTMPLPITQMRAVIDTTPKTYTQEPTKNGWRLGKRWVSGRRGFRRGRAAPVQVASPGSGAGWLLGVLIVIRFDSVMCREGREECREGDEDHPDDDDQVRDGNHEET